MCECLLVLFVVYVLFSFFSFSLMITTFHDIAVPVLREIYLNEFSVMYVLYFARILYPLRFAALGTRRPIRKDVNGVRLIDTDT